MPDSNYSGDPSDSDLDWVRFTVGDTDPNDWQLKDAEIGALLDSLASREEAALAAVRAMLARASRLVDKSRGDAHDALSQRRAGLKELLDQLTAQLGGGSAAASTPTATGNRFSEKAAAASDADRRPDWARYGIHDPDEGLGGG